MRYFIVFIIFFINTCFAEVNYVAAGANQVILNSEDGINWKYISLSSQFPSKDFNGITYGNNTWVAVGTYGSIATSTDANSWEDHSLVPSTSTLTFYSVIYYHNVFYASTLSSIYQSGDGKNWVETVDNIGFQIKRLMIANDKLFGVGYGGVCQLGAFGWSTIYKGNGTYRSIAYGNKIYVINDQSGVYSLISNDGSNWTTINYAGNSEFTNPEAMSSIFNGSIFVAANHYGETSNDGINWNYKAFTIDGAVTSGQFQFLTMIYDGQKWEC